MIRQKPLEPDLANNYDVGWFFGHGAHMPIAVFVQSQERRRSQEGHKGRIERYKKKIAEKNGEPSQGKENRKVSGDPRVSKSGWKILRHFMATHGMPRTKPNHQEWVATDQTGFGRTEQRTIHI